MSTSNPNYSSISVDKYFIAITVVYIALFYYFFSTNPTGEDQPGWSDSNSFFLVTVNTIQIALYRLKEWKTLT